MSGRTGGHQLADRLSAPGPGNPRKSAAARHCDRRPLTGPTASAGLSGAPRKGVHFVADSGATRHAWVSAGVPTARSAVRPWRPGPPRGAYESRCTQIAGSWRSQGQQGDRSADFVPKWLPRWRAHAVTKPAVSRAARTGQGRGGEGRGFAKPSDRAAQPRPSRARTTRGRLGGR